MYREMREIRSQPPGGPAIHDICHQYTTHRQSVRTIAFERGVAPYTVWTWLHRAGVEMRTPGRGFERGPGAPS